MKKPRKHLTQYYKTKLLQKYDVVFIDYKLSEHSDFECFFELSYPASPGNNMTIYGHSLKGQSLEQGVKYFVERFKTFYEKEKWRQEQ